MLFKLTMLAGAILLFLLSDVLFGTTLLSATVAGGLLVTVGPLLGAVLAYRLPAVKSLWLDIVDMFTEEEAPDAAMIKEIEQVAYIWQADGYRGLEKATRKISDPLLRIGVGLVADCCEPAEVRTILERQSRLYFSGRAAQGGIFRFLARQAQTFGLVGTVIGMIMALRSVGDPIAIGNGMAVALFSTLFGLLLANLVYRPLHGKFKELLRREYKSQLLIMDGVNYLATGKCSRAIAYRLQPFLEVEEEPLSGGNGLMHERLHRFAA